MLNSILRNDDRHKKVWAHSLIGN
uniref:Uncharacterized protein n=1 Tax=Anguilla anguilla TaxID=7936 RepID=A0A0E9RUN5_ANGAN